MDPKRYLDELQCALQQYRFRDVRPLTDPIDPATFDLPQIKKALGLIRRKRLFADLEHAASLFSIAGREEIAETGEAAWELGPEGDSLPDRHGGFDRAERTDMLGHDLPAGAAGLDQAGLKTIGLPPKSDEHIVVV